MHALGAALLAAALMAFAAGARAADEPEVDVRGCVVDSGGQPFRNVSIELSGLNYRGGAGYTGNNSVDTTNERGEFLVRMKAGTKQAPARAKISGRYDIYVTRGWTGGGRPGGADVWPDLPPVENTGQPVDLRRNGCIRFNYPFDVSGSVVSELLDSPYPNLTLRITVGSDYSTHTTYIPRPGLTQTFNFGIDLRKGDQYTVDIPQQPKGVQCDIITGSGGYGGEPGTELLFGSYNVWTSKRLQVSCHKAPPEKTAAEKEAEEKVAAEPVLLRRGANSGSSLTGTVIAQTLVKADPVATAPVAPAPQTRADRINAAREQCVAAEATCNKGCLGVAALGVLSIFSGNRAGATAATEQTQQCGDRCTDARSACDQQVADMEGGATGVIAQERSGLSFEDCQRQENASDIGRRLTALPDSNVNLKTRGIIAASDFMIRTYSQCLPDRRAQQVIDQYKAVREQTLRTCRQSSTTDNCLSSPFGNSPAPSPVVVRPTQPVRPPSQEPAVCTPGSDYDARACSCLKNPAGAGCPGAKDSGGVSRWRR